MEWRPIETAPKDGTDILLIDSASKKPLADLAHWDRRFCVWVACSQVTYHSVSETPYEIGMYGTPTHWMPLPDPPES